VNEDTNETTVPTYGVWKQTPEGYREVQVEGFRDGELDDLYWSNKFGSYEREQEARAFLAK